MDSIELILADLGEEATKRIARKQKPIGLKDNIDVAKRGGKIAKNTREDLEKEIGETIVTSNNSLNYQYIDQKELDIKKE